MAKKVLVGMSGGVDSALLLAAACQAATAGRFPVWAVYFDTALHPAGDCEEAGRLARERIESAERSDKLPDDAFFDFDPDFMDGMP